MHPQALRERLRPAALCGLPWPGRRGRVPGRRWAARISGKGEQIIFCALIRKVGSLKGGGWCLREKAGSGAASTVLVGKWIKTSKWSFYKKLKDGAAGHLLPLALFKI